MFSDCTDVSACAANTCATQTTITQAEYTKFKAGTCATVFSTDLGTNIALMITDVQNVSLPDCVPNNGNSQTPTYTTTIDILSYTNTACSGAPVHSETYNTEPPLDNMGSCHRDHLIEQNGVAANVVNTQGSMVVCNDDGGATYLEECTDVSTCAASTCGVKEVYTPAIYANLKAGNCVVTFSAAYGMDISSKINQVQNAKFPDCTVLTSDCKYFPILSCGKIALLQLVMHILLMNFQG